MADNLSGIIAYTNGVYRVEKLSYDEDVVVVEVGEDTPPNWGIVNEEYGTVEQVTYILFQAMEACDSLKEALAKLEPTTATQLKLL